MHCAVKVAICSAEIINDAGLLCNHLNRSSMYGYVKRLSDVVVAETTWVATIILQTFAPGRVDGRIC